MPAAGSAAVAAAAARRANAARSSPRGTPRGTSRGTPRGSPNNSPGGFRVGAVQQPIDAVTAASQARNDTADGGLAELKARYAAIYEFSAEEVASYAAISALYDVPPALMVQGPSGQIYHSRALCCLRPAMEPRRSAISLVESRWFDPLILATILCNCTTMAWESPLDPPGTWKAGFIDTCEWTYLYIFTAELLSKARTHRLRPR